MNLEQFDKLYSDAQLDSKPFTMLILPSLIESRVLQEDVSSGFGLMEVSRKTDSPKRSEEFKLHGHRKVMQLRGVDIFVPDWDIK